MKHIERASGRALRIALLIALLLLLPAALLLAAPAGLASRIVAASTPELRLFAPSGRLLNGSADLVVADRVFGRLTWRIDPVTLLGGRLTAQLSLVDPGHDARAQLTVRPNGDFDITAFSAEIREQTLDALLRPYAIEPEGRIEVPAGLVRGRLPDRHVTDANAQAHWSGGLVRYRLGGGSWTASLPPLHAQLHMREGIPVLVVRDADGAELLDISLRAHGWADLRVRYHFVALTGYPWPDPPAPDVIVVEISEQLL